MGHFHTRIDPCHEWQKIYNIFDIPFFISWRPFCTSLSDNIFLMVRNFQKYFHNIFIHKVRGWLDFVEYLIKYWDSYLYLWRFFQWIFLHRHLKKYFCKTHSYFSENFLQSFCRTYCLQEITIFKKVRKKSPAVILGGDDIYRVDGNRWNTLLQIFFRRGREPFSAILLQNFFPQKNPAGKRAA